MTTRSTSEKQKTEAATTSSVQTASKTGGQQGSSGPQALASSQTESNQRPFSGFWYWGTEMERLGQWPGISDILKERALEGGSQHVRTTHANRIHTPSVLRR